MFLYRIASCKRIHDLTGTGGLYASGRWHNKGTKIIYFSEHISLAKLEVLANTNFLPKNSCLLTVKIHKSIKVYKIPENKLPRGWDGYPHIDSLKKLTVHWLSVEKSLLMRVPSAQSSPEYNYLLNPLHTDISKVKIESIEPVKFDQRLKL